MTVHKPLPTEVADRLLAHLATCPQCKRAVSHRRRHKICPTGRMLIRLTITERHPDDDER